MRDPQGVQYVIWQNRAVRFYRASRRLVFDRLFGPAAFTAYQALETLVKATLVYWDKTFVPEKAGHRLAGMLRAIENKVPSGRVDVVPRYFFADDLFRVVSRYPSSGLWIAIPPTFLDDLDSAVVGLVELVPFQFNSELSRILRGPRGTLRWIVTHRNTQSRRLQKHVLGRNG